MNKKFIIFTSIFLSILFLSLIFYFSYFKEVSTPIKNSIQNTPISKDNMIKDREKESFFDVPEFSLRDKNGKTVNLSDYKGKVIIIHFWTTWCEHCLLEMPLFDEIHAKYKDKNFMVLGICPYVNENYIFEFVEIHKYKFKILVDTKEEVTKSYKINSYPTTLLVDQKGKLVERIDDSVKRDQLIDSINKLNP
jgi:cytochrome c biogenesis protein CcmG, thiol:disulfide interchange protein DsbE